MDGSNIQKDNGIHIFFSSCKKGKKFAIFSYLVGFYQSVKWTSLFRPEMAYIFGMAA